MTINYAWVNEENAQLKKWIAAIIEEKKILTDIAETSKKELNKLKEEFI